MNKLNTLKQQIKNVSTSPSWTSAFDNFLDTSRTVLSSTVTLSNPVNTFDPITLPAGYRIVGYGMRINDDVSINQRIDAKFYYPQFTLSTKRHSSTNSAITFDEMLTISSSNAILTGDSGLDLNADGGVQGPFYSDEPYGSVVLGSSQLAFNGISSSLELPDGELVPYKLTKGVIVSHFDESWYTNTLGGQGYSELNYWGGYDGASSQAMAPQQDINYYFKLGFVTLNTTAALRKAYTNYYDVGEMFPLTGKVEDESIPYDMYTSYVKPEALMNPSATATAYINIQKII